MFEKEAEEYADKNATRGGSSSFGDITNYHDLREGFKDGAEFGYNKGYHDAEEHYMNVIDSQHKLVEESKANEFHYCKDGLPEKEKSVLIYTEIKNVYMAKLVKDDYFITKEGGYVQTFAVIAWKEIVLPELKESE